MAHLQQHLHAALLASRLNLGPTLIAEQASEALVGQGGGLNR